MTPLRLTLRTRSHSSSSVWTKNAKRSVPALLTRTSTRPTASTPERTDATSATSICTAWPSMSPATPRAPSSSRSAMATCAPSAARRSAVALPMPLAPPVTSARLPSNLIRGSDLRGCLGTSRAHEVPRRPLILAAPHGRPSGDHRRHGRARLRPRGPLVARRCARDHRLTRRGACAGGGAEGRRGGRDGERRGRAGGVGRRAHGPVPQPVREPHQPQGRAARGPAVRRLHGPARRRGQRPRDARARRLAGLGRTAGGGDGPRRSARRLGAAHDQRRDARRPRPRARRGRAHLWRPQGRQARDRAADRAHRRPAPGGRRPPRAVAHRRVAHRAADRDQRALQDPRGDPDHGAARRVVARVVVLAGGTGGAKLARGMLDVAADELTVIANTGDDVEIYGAYVSPDPDLVAFWLADVIDERG